MFIWKPFSTLRRLLVTQSGSSYVQKDDTTVNNNIWLLAACSNRVQIQKEKDVHIIRVTGPEVAFTFWYFTHSDLITTIIQYAFEQSTSSLSSNFRVSLLFSTDTNKELDSFAFAHTVLTHIRIGLRNRSQPPPYRMPASTPLRPQRYVWALSLYSELYYFPGKAWKYCISDCPNNNVYVAILTVQGLWVCKSSSVASNYLWMKIVSKWEKYLLQYSILQSNIYDVNIRHVQ